MKTISWFLVLSLFCAACATDDITLSGTSTVDAGNSADSGDLAKQDTVSSEVKAPSECESKVECDDGNACTFDACELGKCVHVEMADKIACNDGDPCTSGICKQGACFQNKTEGTDGVKGCVPCKEETDCGPQGYFHYCKGDHQQDEKLLGCVAGVCQWGVNSFTCDAGCDSATGMCKSECFGDKDCDDKVACTADICTSAHKCSHIPADNLCGDGKFCIIQENGSTLPSGCYECKGNNGDCNDGNLCTDDTCVAGKCENPAVDTNFLPVGCDVDANACTIDYCSDGMCKTMAVGQTKCGECQTDQDCLEYTYAGPYCSQDNKFAYFVEHKKCEMSAGSTVGLCKPDITKKLACPKFGCTYAKGKEEPFKCE